jgi:hypothetical protein
VIRSRDLPACRIVPQPTTLPGATLVYLFIYVFPPFLPCLFFLRFLPVCALSLHFVANEYPAVSYAFSVVLINWVPHTHSCLIGFLECKFIPFRTYMRLEAGEGFIQFTNWKSGLQKATVCCSGIHAWAFPVVMTIEGVLTNIHLSIGIFDIYWSTLSLTHKVTNWSRYDFILISSSSLLRVCGSVVGWGTMLQAGRSRVLFPLNLPSPSSRTMSLVSTQPLTEMNTRNLPSLI